LCCGDEPDAVVGEARMPGDDMVEGTTPGYSEQEESIAVGIFRGEGHVGCHLNRRETRFGRHPELLAGVNMCDRNSVEIVAKVWGSKVYRNGGGKCLGGDFAWQTRIFGVSRVKKEIGGWVAKGLLRGEKADQYFEALAKCRRARVVFLEEPGNFGRPREIF
jgi:hypothetical protein